MAAEGGVTVSHQIMQILQKNKTNKKQIVKLWKKAQTKNNAHFPGICNKNLCTI